MKKTIVGIQQVGIGVKDVREAWKWYREILGMDIRIFEDTAVAKLMLHYTNGQECERFAALAMNMEGGGGFEIWQHTGFTPKSPVFEVQLGDCGIYICKMKCRNVQKAYETHQRQGIRLLGAPGPDPQGRPHYYLQDPWNNLFEIVEEHNYFMKQKSPTGGVAGVVIGVSDIDEALKVYADILEYEQVVYDQTDQFDDLSALPGGTGTFRRVLLKHKKRKGPFSNLLGPTQIELVQTTTRSPRKIFQNRIWGELGFIHLCFDIQGMSMLGEECRQKGFPFTVNSADSFDMGTAAGHFTYISDPDGTPIEFVETHKLPIMEKIGWSINLAKRGPGKPLPNWILKALAFNRVK